MELRGTRLIAADRITVWSALNDPDILKSSIPGCSEMIAKSNHGFEAVVTQKIGPVKATFKGQVDLSDIVEGESYKISGQGKGGPAGYAKGDALVTLEDADGGTLLTYDVDAKVGGKLASLGARLIHGVAKKLADQFFENFQLAVEGAASDDDADQAEPVQRTGMLGGFLNWLKGLIS